MKSVLLRSVIAGALLTAIFVVTFDWAREDPDAPVDLVARRSAPSIVETQVTQLLREGRYVDDSVLTKRLEEMARSYPDGWIGLLEAANVLNLEGQKRECRLAYRAALESIPDLKALEDRPLLLARYCAKLKSAAAMFDENRDGAALEKVTRVLSNCHDGTRSGFELTSQLSWSKYLQEDYRGALTLIGESRRLHRKGSDGDAAVLQLSWIAGLCHHELDDQGQALKCFDEVRRQPGPHQADAAALVVIAYARLEDRAKAMEAFNNERELIIRSSFAMAAQSMLEALE